MSRFNFYLIILIVFALPSYLVKFSIFGIPTTLLEVLIYLSFIITLILRRKKLRQDLKDIIKCKFFIPTVLFFIAGIISIIVAPEKQAALGLFKGYIFDPTLFFFVLISNFKNYKIENSLEIGNWKLEIIFKSLILSGVVLSIHAIYQYLIGDLTIDGRVLGVYKLWENASPNYLALYLAPIVILHIAYRISHIDKKLSSLLLYCFITLLLFFALYLTGSRAAIGSVVVGISALVIMRYWNWIQKKKIIVTLLYCYIAILLIGSWFMIKPDFSLSPEDGGRITSSNNIRWEIYKTTGEILKDKWLLGVGLGNYQNYFTELTKNRVNFPEYIAPKSLTPHNIFLNIWVNMGLLGLVSFVWLLVLFFKFSISNFQFSKDKNHTTYYPPATPEPVCHDWYCRARRSDGGRGLLLTSVMVTLLAQGMLDTPYWKNDLAVMFWIIFAMAIINVKAQMTNVK